MRYQNNPTNHPGGEIDGHRENQERDTNSRVPQSLTYRPQLF
jgi:hypothetical protein